MGYQGELERLRGQIKSFNEEMGTDLLSQLTTEDQEEVSIFLFIQIHLQMVWIRETSAIYERNYFFSYKYLLKWLGITGLLFMQILLETVWANEALLVNPDRNSFVLFIYITIIFR